MSGLGGDGAGEGDALLHAAREFGRIEIADAGGKADLGEEFGGTVAAFGTAQPALGEQAEHDVLPDRQAVEQRAVLEQHADAGTDGFLFAAGKAEDVGAVDLDAACVGFEQAEDAFE